MTEKEKQYNNDDIFERDFKKLYAQVMQKYSTKKLRKYIHYKSTYNLYVGLKTPNIKRKSLKFRVLLIKYLRKIILEDLFIEGETLHNELTSKDLFQNYVKKIALFLSTYDNFSAIIFLRVNFFIVFVLIFLVGYYFMSWIASISLLFLVAIIYYLYYQRKKKKHKLYGISY